MEIAQTFRAMYDRDLILVLQYKFSGKEVIVIKALLTPLPEFFAQQLFSEIDSFYADDSTFIEIIIPLSNSQINIISYTYEKSEYFFIVWL